MSALFRHSGEPQDRCTGDSLGTPSACAYRRLSDARATQGRDTACNSAASVRLGVGDLGVGVFASRLLRPGEVILRFSGRTMAFADAVALGEWQCYALQVDSGRVYIDPDPPGRFVNHSCDPNAGVRGRDLVAVREIRGGAEIRFDYSTTMDEDYWEMPCRCGAAGCRGRIRDFKHLPREVQQRYRQLDILPPFIALRYA